MSYRSGSAGRQRATSSSSGTEPEEPDALADVLSDRWPVQLGKPSRPGSPWTMTLTADD